MKRLVLGIVAFLAAAHLALAEEPRQVRLGARFEW